MRRSSVIVGLMVTIGSAGIVDQAMSGLVLRYSRALNKGERVQIADTEGIVGIGSVGQCWCAAYQDRGVSK